MKGKILFEEEQSFKQTAFFPLVVIVTIGISGLLIYGCVQQLLLGNSFGSKPASDQSLLMITAFTIVLLVLVVSLFTYAKLRLQIDAQTIRYRFPPFMRSFREVPLENVQSMAVKRYSPVFEYGGWGYRIGYKKKALNVSGDMGLEIVFADGKKLLIGTQKPEELRTVLLVFNKKVVD